MSLRDQITEIVGDPRLTDQILQLFIVEDTYDPGEEQPDWPYSMVSPRRRRYVSEREDASTPDLDPVEADGS